MGTGGNKNEPRVWCQGVSGGKWVSGTLVRAFVMEKCERYCEGGQAVRATVYYAAVQTVGSRTTFLSWYTDQHRCEEEVRRIADEFRRQGPEEVDQRDA